MIAVESNLSKLRVLILSKDLFAEGGVANSIRIQIENSSEDIQAEHFSIGNSIGITGRLKGSYLAARDSFRLYRKLIRSKYDCVQINPSLRLRSLLRDGLFLFLISSSGFKKIIVFFRGWDENTERSIKKNAFFRFIFRKLLCRVPMILVLGKKFKDFLIEIGLSEKRIKVVNNFFDGSIFQGLKRKNTSDEKRILFLSRIIKEKGVFEILDAFKLVTPDFPNAKLVFAGEGPEMASLRRRVIEYGLRDRVDFLGYIRDAAKAQVLIDSDIFVLPTYGEGCPRALLEAMAAGLPVITCPVGGIPDIFENKKNGMFLPDLSPLTISDAMRFFLESPSVCYEIGENNRRHAWDKFEVGAVIRRVEKLYAEVAGKSLLKEEMYG